MYPERVDHHKHDSNQRNEDDVDGGGNKSLHVAANFLQLAQRFSAALVFEDLVGQVQRMPDAVGIHLRSQPLNNHVGEIILEILGHARYKRDAHRRQQQQPGPANELRLRVLVIFGGITVDHMTKDQRVKKGENLIGRGQQKRH